MEVDLYVVSTLYKFTKNAIKKALHYGVIIETAEMINKNKIEKLDKEFFYDIFYIIPSLTKLTFLLEDNKIINFKELTNRINMIDKQQLMNALNYLLLSNIDVTGLIEKIGIKSEDYFKYDNNHWCNFTNTIGLNDNKLDIFKKIKIKSINYCIRIKPFRLSLPINKSLSTFEVVDKKNKAFKVYFGNDDDNVVVGYLDNEKIIAKVHQKKKKNHRIVGGNMVVNTIFPKNAKVDFEIDNIEEVAVNSFDYSQVL